MAFEDFRDAAKFSDGKSLHDYYLDNKASRDALQTANNPQQPLGIRDPNAISFTRPMEGSQFSTLHTSHTNPTTGAPIQKLITPAGMPTRTSGFEMMFPPYGKGNGGLRQPQAPVRNDPNYEQQKKDWIAAETPQPVPGSQGEDPNGYAMVAGIGGRINYGDIGTSRDVALGNATNTSFSVLPPETPVTPTSAGAATQPGGLRFKSVNDFTGGARPQTGLGALLSLGLAGQQAGAYNEQVKAQMEHETKLGEIGLGLRKIQMEEPYFAAHGAELGAIAVERRARAAKELFAASPAGIAAEQAKRGKDAETLTQQAADKAYTEAINRNPTDLTAAENARASVLASSKGLRIIPGTPGTPAKKSLFGLRTVKGTPATSPVAASPEAVSEYNAARAATADPDKLAAIDARFRALYGSGL